MCPEVDTDMEEVSERPQVFKSRGAFPAAQASRRQ
jgi:ubiquitin carboxyl-terminal hydrolase 36/42